MKTSWTAPYAPHYALSVLRDLALMHAAEAGPSKARLTELVRRSDWQALIQHEEDYRDVRHTPLSVYHARQVVALFKKYEALPLDIDKEAVAYQKFCESEARCKHVNETLEPLLASSELASSAASVIHGAMRKIARVLGDVPTMWDLNPRFGPGATTSVKAKSASPRWKLGARLECSNELLSSAHSALQTVESWYGLHAIDGNERGCLPPKIYHVPGKLQFVPKSAKEHRSIVVEPTLNGFFQLGIGTFMKGKLLRAGVNLYDQSTNQRLSREALYKGLATIDLSAASDSIAKATVRALLPMDWYDFLSRFRTGRVTYKHGEVESTLILEKFSSMGNGFTFELETLIFWSLAHATADTLGYHTRDISVYGDDIIVPAGCVELLTEVFTLFGFVVNRDKSFVDPPFFESCGTDWYYGFDVRPYYQKAKVSAETLFVLHNFYKRNYYDAFAKKVRKYIHPSLKIFGPDGYGDGHLLGPWAKFAKAHGRKRGWEGFCFDTFSHRPSKLRASAAGDRILPSYTIYCASSAVDVRQIFSPDVNGRYRPRLVAIEPGAETDIFTVRGSAGYRRSSIYTLTNPF